MMILGVVADDLTGAGDAGAALARHGWPALILVQGIRGVPVREVRRRPVVIVNTESRHLAPAAAARRTAAACAWLRRAGATWIFKKIDSTLRGYPVREALAGARAVKARRIPWVPAFPAAGRTTVGGVHRVAGRPVAEGFAGRDPRSPVPDSHLPAVIRRWARLDARRFAVPLNVRTTAELRRVARSFKRDRYAAGSAGFLDALLACWFARSVPSGVWVTGHARQKRALRRACLGLSSRADGPYAHTPRVSGPVLVVCGSATDAARRQVAVYRKRFPVDSVVATPVRQGNAGQVMRKVVTAAEKLAQRVRPAGLILAGGETAWKVAMRLGIRGLVVKTAVAQGVAGCEVTMATNGWMGARVVLKPGGFGGDDALIQARRWITG